MRLKASKLSGYANGKLIYGSGENEIRDIKTDSREAGPGDLFLPVIGERVDGHRFLKDVVKGGAACIFTMHHKDLSELKADKELYLSLMERGDRISVISVEDTIGALQRAARSYRQEQLSALPIVGVTGSVGKTTTREMIACALSAERSVFATKGNKNSQIGLPMTVLDIGDEDMAVLELGISMPGEMDRIAAIAGPETAVMTNIGTSHIEYLGSRENILKEKLRIVLGAGKPVSLIVNGEDELLSGLTMERLSELSIDRDSLRSICFCGFSENCDVRGEDLRLSEGHPELTVAFYRREACGSLSKEPYKRHELKLRALGEHMALDALLALAVCERYGIDTEKACRKLEGFESLKGRGETFEHDGITVINDSYNASPDSMKASLRVLNGMRKGKRRIAVLGDMLELGPDSARLHAQIGDFIASELDSIDMLLLYGEHSKAIGDAAGRAEAADIRYFTDRGELERFIKGELQPGDIILFKASNSMGFSTLIRELFKEA